MRNLGVRSHRRHEGVYTTTAGGPHVLATVNLTPGKIVYGEETVRQDGTEYRLWDPFRSKLAAAILKGLSSVPIRPATEVLYIGAASGTTASHVSDIVGEKGRVYCVEFAQRSFRDLVENVCKNRTNMTPIFGDARFPYRYRSLIADVDSIFCDIAQPDQARILDENARVFLKQEGQFLIAIKARSIDVSENPSNIFRRETELLTRQGYHVTETVRLDPFELDHCMVRGERTRK